MNLVQRTIPFLACAVFSAALAVASPIAVSNASFETLGPGGLPGSCGTDCSFSSDGVIPGWATSGVVGLFQPGPPATTTYFDSVPDGVTIAYSNGGSISQLVAATVQASTIYTLLVDQGVRKDIPDPGTIALLINGNTYVGVGAPSVPGGFSTYTVAYDSSLHPLDVGSSITIVLNSTGAQGDWDNVRLSDNAAAGGVPEPISLLLLGSGLGLVLILRKFVAVR